MSFLKQVQQVRMFSLKSKPTSQGELTFDNDDFSSVVSAGSESDARSRRSSVTRKLLKKPSFSAVVRLIEEVKAEEHSSTTLPHVVEKKLYGIKEYLTMPIENMLVTHEEFTDYPAGESIFFTLSLQPILSLIAEFLSNDFFNVESRLYYSYKAQPSENLILMDSMNWFELQMLTKYSSNRGFGLIELDRIYFLQEAGQLNMILKFSKSWTDALNSAIRFTGIRLGLHKRKVVVPLVQLTFLTTNNLNLISMKLANVKKIPFKIQLSKEKQLDHVNMIPDKQWLVYDDGDTFSYLNRSTSNRVEDDILSNPGSEVSRTSSHL